MIGAIAGDIIGSRFEGHPAPPSNFDLFHSDCCFTDDTVCTLAVAEAMLSNQPFELVLRSFVRRYPDAGYGGMFLRWAFDDEAGPYGSWGNGAPMRVSAVGWLARDETEVLRLAARQSAVSHDHPDAIQAAQAVALAIHLLRAGAGLDGVQTRIEKEFGYDLSGPEVLKRRGFDVSATGTVPPALAAAFQSTSLENAIRIAVGIGGDTDTLACLAGAVAEAVHGVPSEVTRETRARLPVDLLQALDRFKAAAGT
ncbi:ADP-ribosylglycohydrolase family protein [Mesorhizobium xinjiangense]|uniref:ADP-ribosylglycohydrolase family protein n=1 Tax=Mesorhizobium xinjiangense TaxID=2678685 RepID=UPI0012ED7BF9|nr:ADP-ribosylglycohydrolase family protein [Mesorhizobium xinjiangense]